jgi:hypothetical protein
MDFGLFNMCDIADRVPSSRAIQLASGKTWGLSLRASRSSGTRFLRCREGFCEPGPGKSKLDPGPSYDRPHPLIDLAIGRVVEEVGRSRPPDDGNRFRPTPDEATGGIGGVSPIRGCSRPRSLGAGAGGAAAIRR